MLRTAYFRFYEELNQYLSPEFSKRPFACEFRGTPLIVDVLKDMGVDPAAIDLILVNGDSVDWDRCLQGGEYVSVYPVFESFDISPLIKLRSSPLRKVRFFLDTNLEQLGKRLRELGFDVLFREGFQESEILELANQERRIILTQNSEIFKNSQVTHCYLVQNKSLQAQLQEVGERFQLRDF